MSSCSNVCGSRQAPAATEGGHQRYGVRSYLHQFYEDCTTSIWEYEDDFQIQRSPNRWSSVFWKVGLISGTVFVILGLTVLAVGFLVPPKIEAFGEANFVVVDTHAIHFNGALDMCKLAGAVLFCIGGTSMAGCLLMSVFAKTTPKKRNSFSKGLKSESQTSRPTHSPSQELRAQEKQRYQSLCPEFTMSSP